MKNLLVVLIIMIAVFPSVYSAGGGGGGSLVSAPSCSKDTWECSDWGSCNIRGIHLRVCKMTFDCSTANTPKPLESENCEYTSQIIKKLKCGNLDTLKERVTCRLSLAPDQQQEELEIQYLPEECRTLPSDIEKDACITQYGKVQSCWKISPGDDRINCVKQKIGMRELRLEKAQCQKQGENEKVNCMHSIREKGYSIIKFRLYDLEERAEKFIDRGADKNLVSNFVASMEEKKMQFNKADTAYERKQVLLDTRELWKQFIKSIKSGKKL